MRARGSAGCAAGNEASSHSEAYAEPRLPRRWSSPRLLLLVSVLALLAIFGIALLGTATRIHGGAAAYVSAQVRPLLHRPTSSSFDRDAESTFADPSYLHLLPPPPPLRWDMSHSTKAHHRSSNSSARQRHESGAARTRGARAPPRPQRAAGLCSRGCTRRRCEYETHRPRRRWRPGWWRLQRPRECAATSTGASSCHRCLTRARTTNFYSSKSRSRRRVRQGPSCRRSATQPEFHFHPQRRRRPRATSGWSKSGTH